MSRIKKDRGGVPSVCYASTIAGAAPRTDLASASATKLADLVESLRVGRTAGMGSRPVRSLAFLRQADSLRRAGPARRGENRSRTFCQWSIVLTSPRVDVLEECSEIHELIQGLGKESFRGRWKALCLVADLLFELRTDRSVSSVLLG